MNPGPTPSPDYPLRMRPDGNTARAAAVPAVVLLVVAVVIGSLVVRPAATQEDGGTDTTVDPTAGATTPATGPESPAPGETPTTLADLETPEGPVREAPLTESERASRTIDWVVAGLLLLALVVAVATVVFWRRTRPSRLVAEEMAETARQRGPGPSPAAGPEAARSQPEARQPGAPDPAAPRPPRGATGPATAVAGPPKPLPTAPGSWNAFAAEVGLDASEGPTEPSPEQPADAQQPSVAQPPRPAFETASTGSWASQGWGDRGGDAAPVLPQGSADSDVPKGSWRWNERAGRGQDAAGPAAPPADPAESELHEVEGGRAEGGQEDGGDPGAGVSGPL
jgi:hypothetical protein